MAEDHSWELKYHYFSSGQTQTGHKLPFSISLSRISLTSPS